MLNSLGVPPASKFPWSYVPDTIAPVIGIASCNKVFVVVTSLFRNVLNVVAMFYPYVFLRYLTGISIEYAVVADVNLTIESMYLNS